MHIRNYILTMVFVLAMGLPSLASTGLVLELKNGTTEIFILEDKPTLTFVESTLNIKSLEAEASVSLLEVSNFHFVEVESGIESFKSEGLIFEYKEGRATIEGYNGIINVFDTSAALILSDKNESGFTQLDLNGLAPGIYLIQVGIRTIKVNVK